MTPVGDLRGAAVLVLGDLMLDEYIWGSVDRISPEAPVPVVAVERRTHVPGGAANAAAGIVALEGTALLGGALGDDAAGADLRAALASREGIDLSGLVVDPTRPTTIKTRVVANAQQVVRTDSETRDPLPAEAESVLGHWLESRIAYAGALLISDYGKGVVSDELARIAIAAARQHGKPVVVDSKGIHYSKFRGATVITPNSHDAGRAANVHIEDDEQLAEAARRLSEDCEGAALLITRGAAGMTFFSTGGPVHIPAEAHEVYDVTGAGDTVVAVLAAALAGGVEILEAIRLANSAAAIVVGKVGTSTVSLAELAAGVHA